jgi:hypothetical protein
VSGAVKIAFTVLIALIVTVQVPVPLQAPDQPVKVLPEVGVAVREIIVFNATLVEQLDPQEIDPPELETVPVPVPDLVTKRVIADPEANTALTDFTAFTLTTQVPVPLQAPDQPLKLYPDDGVAVSVTEVPDLTVTEQVAPQEIDPPELETMPEPALVTESV